MGHIPPNDGEGAIECNDEHWLTLTLVRILCIGQVGNHVRAHEANIVRVLHVCVVAAAAATANTIYTTCSINFRLDLAHVHTLPLSGRSYKPNEASVADAVIVLP